MSPSHSPGWTKIFIGNSTQITSTKRSCEIKLVMNCFDRSQKENYAPKVDYVVLYENENYKGIYSIVEGVDEFRLGLDLKDPKAVLFKEPPLHFPPSEHASNATRISRTTVRSMCAMRMYSQKAKKKLIKRAYYNQRYP